MKKKRAITLDHATINRVFLFIIHVKERKIKTNFSALRGIDKSFLSGLVAFSPLKFYTMVSNMVHWKPLQANSLPTPNLIFWPFLWQSRNKNFTLKSIFSITSGRSRYPYTRKKKFFLTVINTSNEYMISLFR